MENIWDHVAGAVVIRVSLSILSNDVERDWECVWTRVSSLVCGSSYTTFASYATSLMMLSSTQRDDGDVS